MTALAGRRRRRLLKQAGLWAVAALTGTGLPERRAAMAAPTAADASAGFEATSVEQVLRALGGEPAEHASVSLTAPDVAEDGAVVAVSVSVDSRLPGTCEIAIVVDGNPNPLVARFLIAPDTEPFVSTRVKMAQSGRVRALVRADGGWYGASRYTTVTVGACGG